ncbi:MAG: sugar ABC transporter substrate-binding protein [Solirubrobacterales bacterium]|nr:sugar ABC transporter substrate-binding protein [Solirubrobacterales bacterium]
MKLRILGLLCLVFALGSLVVACGDSDSSDGDKSGDTTTAVKLKNPVDIDVGLDKPVTVGPEVKIALFSASGTDWLTALNSSTEDAAKAAGYEITTFDSALDPTKQLNQMENALQSGEYNVWMVQPFDSQLLCDITSKQAPAKNIAVISISNPVCDRALKPAGDDLWQPGTMAVVNGENSVTYKAAWLKEIFNRLTADGGDKKVIMLTGPKEIGNTQTFEGGLQQVTDEGDADGIDVVASVRSDFTTPTSLTMMEDALQANPDVDAVISVYSDMTRGAIAALTSAGMDDVKVYDMGASKYSVDQIKAGKMEMTVPYAPAESGTASVELLTDVLGGDQPKRFVDVFEPDNSVRDPLFIDSENADSYQPTY